MSIFGHMEPLEDIPLTYNVVLSCAAVAYTDKHGRP